MTITKKYLNDTLDKKFQVAFKKQDERFAQMLMKHFYTKDEIDRKLANLPTREDLKKAVNDGVDRVMVLFEDNKSKTELVAENQTYANSKIQDHEGRIIKLEDKL